MVSNFTNLEMFDFPYLDEWFDSTNKETTLSNDSFYFCNPNFIVDFIPNIVGNNKENQLSLNNATTSTFFSNSTFIPMVPYTSTLENSIPTVDEGLTHSSPSTEAKFEYDDIS